MPAIRAIAYLNNAISAHLGREILRADGVPPGEVLLLQGRVLNRPWMAECGANLPYPGPASLRLAGQARFLGYYREASRRIRAALAAGEVREVYLVNNDNLITAHLLAAAARRPELRVTVVAEGLMNYQDITTKNRAGWRFAVKRLVAGALGYRWQAPQGHLSGAFEPVVRRVVSFTARGLVAPPEKVTVIPFTVPPDAPALRADTVLLAESALWQWFKDEAQFRRLADGLGAWRRALAPARFLIKPHPNYPPSEYQRRQLEPYELVTERGSVEELAGRLDAATVVGTCTTALFTLKLMRPELRCVDFGSDVYVPHAYFGDDSVVKTLAGVGVEIVGTDGRPRIRA